MKINFQEIYERYDIEDIVKGMGITLKGGSCKWGLCVLPNHVHKSYTPSFSIYWKNGKQRWKCHGQCGVGGDVIDLAGYLWIPGYNPKRDRTKAAERLIGDRPLKTKIVTPSQSPTISPWLWEEMLPPSKDIIKYAISRGLTIDQIDKFRIGTPKEWMGKKYNIHSPKIWMAIPTFHDGELIGIKLRNTTKFGLRYMSVPGSRKGLFNYDAVNMSEGVVLVLKGEIAVMVADRFGFLACAPTAGEGSYIDNIKHALIFSKNIVVGDNDKGEIVERTREQAKKRALVLNADIHFPPEKYHDIDEFLLADQQAAEIIKGWIAERSSKP